MRDVTHREDAQRELEHAQLPRRSALCRFKFFRFDTCVFLPTFFPLGTVNKESMVLHIVIFDLEVSFAHLRPH